MAIKLFGKSVSTPMAVTIAGGSGIAIWFAWKQHKSSAAAASSSSNPASIDPATGLPYSQDNQVDPLTGMTYLAEAQEYGSVSAAEQAVAGEAGDSLTSAGSNAGLSSLTGSSTGTSLEAVPGGYATNAAWAQAVTAGLANIGYSATDVSSALGMYLGGLPLSTLADGVSSASIVSAAIAEYGPPPVGTFTMISAPSSSTAPVSTGTGTTTTPTGTTPAPVTTTTPPASTQVNEYPAPSGLHVVSTTSNWCEVQWDALSPAPPSYTVACYQENGKDVNEFSTTNTIANIGALVSKYSYNIHVWANGGKVAPPHATVSVTLP